MSILKAILADQGTASVSDELSEALRIYDQAVLNLQDAVDNQIRNINSDPILKGK
jgi:hypothetical protein